MRTPYLLLVLLFVLFGHQANSQIRLVMLDQYNLKKGDTLTANLTSHIHLNSESAPHSSATIYTNINLYQKSKKINLNRFVTPDTSLLIYKPALAGLSILEISQKSFAEYSKEEYLANLKEQGLNATVKDLESILNNKDRIKDSATFYTKSLIILDKNKPFTKQEIGSDHEFILKDNPFIASYGDQVSALLTLHGKPLTNVPVVLYIKTDSGNITSEFLTTDANGMVGVKLSVEGVYFLQHLYVAEVSTKNEVNSRWTTLSFQFVNTVYKRSNYAEFGF